MNLQKMCKLFNNNLNCNWAKNIHGNLFINITSCWHAFNYKYDHLIMVIFCAKSAHWFVSWEGQMCRLAIFIKKWILNAHLIGKVFISLSPSPPLPLSPSVCCYQLNIDICNIKSFQLNCSNYCFRFALFSFIVHKKFYQRIDVTNVHG